MANRVLNLSMVVSEVADETGNTPIHFELPETFYFSLALHNPDEAMTMACQARTMVAEELDGVKVDLLDMLSMILPYSQYLYQYSAITSAYELYFSYEKFLGELHGVLLTVAFFLWEESLSDFPIVNNYPQLITHLSLL